MEVTVFATLIGLVGVVLSILLYLTRDLKTQMQIQMQELRVELRTGFVDLGARIDGTNARIDKTNARIDGTNVSD